MRQYRKMAPHSQLKLKGCVSTKFVIRVASECTKHASRKGCLAGYITSINLNLCVSNTASKTQPTNFHMLHLILSRADGLAPNAPGGEPNEDGIVGGPRTPQQIAAQKRLQQTQAQVDEVVDIMKTNVEKVLERDQKLSELDDRADALQQGASQFEQQAGKLKRKFWLQNLKMMIIMGVIFIVIVGIIVLKFMPEEKPQPQVVYATHPPLDQSGGAVQTGVNVKGTSAFVQDSFWNHKL
ncbi:hypothetical protein HA402_015340 [Bradysia odoriphaga]|nr:hypothetical protein HA402_015340 [Bradysia odoriphaga]